MNASPTGGNSGSGRVRVGRWNLRRILLLAVANLAVLMILFALAEFAYRKVRLRHSVVSNAPYYQYDSRLGWVPRPGRYFDPAGRAVTVTGEGFRLTAPPAVDPSGPLILTVGCSFTFCEEAADDETWPYYLSQDLGVPVINAGVSSYGFDQMVLRLRDELDRVKPDLVIAAIIWQDVVVRSRLSYRHQHKPYFDIVDGRLELFNQPVPPPWVNPILHPWYERSLLVRDLVHHLSGRPGFVNEVAVHDKGLEVGRRLIIDLREELAERGVPWIIVILPGQPVQPDLDRRHLRELTSMLREINAPFYDLHEEMCRDFPVPETRKILWGAHATPAGNEWIAAVLAQIIRGGRIPGFRVSD